MKPFFLAFFILISSFSSTCPAQTPKPTAAQLAWHGTEFYLFFHFGPNTFTNLEWGHGTETEDIFLPTTLDCEQWCRTAKAAGARGVVITAKHHDGFCLWPSKFSGHTVRESRWKNGHGDVLRELAEACKKYDLKLGFYLSPWDRNHPKYGTPEYNDIYASTLTELLSNYGELFEIWWDGANGEGANGRKQQYDFPRFEKIAARLQPNAVIFSDIGPGCRWAGNENGTIETGTNWCTLDTAGFGRGATGPPAKTLNQGDENGKNWIPAECDVSIRPGWFYHAEEDEKVKTPEQLFKIYLKSVGQGANLILNVPPDRRGLIHKNDSVSLAGFGKMVARAFSKNLAVRRKVKFVDGSFYLKLRKKQSFNCLILRENIADGQFVKKFKVEILEGKTWREIAKSETIGVRKILIFPKTTAQKIRVTVLESKESVGKMGVEVFDF